MLQRANIAYQSLAIPTGRHHLALRYRNPLIPWSAAISAIALIALIPLRRRRRMEPLGRRTGGGEKREFD